MEPHPEYGLRVELPSGPSPSGPSSSPEVVRSSNHVSQNGRRDEVKRAREDLSQVSARRQRFRREDSVKQQHGHRGVSSIVEWCSVSAAEVVMLGRRIGVSLE